MLLFLLLGIKFPVGRLLQIHKNHHSSSKTVSSDSIMLLIRQLVASFVNKAILRSTDLLQRSPVSHGFIHQEPFRLGKHLTEALSQLFVPLVSAVLQLLLHTPFAVRSSTSPETQYTGSSPQRCSVCTLHRLLQQ